MIFLFSTESIKISKERLGTSAAVGDAVGVVGVANVAFIKVDLAGGGAAALHLGLLDDLGHTLTAITSGEVALALRQRVHGRVSRRVEPRPASDPALELGKGGVALQLEVPSAAAGTTGLEEHLRAGYLGEAGHLVEGVAAGKLDTGGDRGTAEGAPHGKDAADAGGAVGGAEVAAALE